MWLTFVAHIIFLLDSAALIISRHIFPSVDVQGLVMSYLILVWFSFFYKGPRRFFPESLWIFLFLVLWNFKRIHWSVGSFCSFCVEYLVSLVCVTLQLRNFLLILFELFPPFLFFFNSSLFLKEKGSCMILDF